LWLVAESLEAQIKLLSIQLPEAPANTAERRLVAVLLAIGAVGRLVWVGIGENLNPITSESHNVAVALARAGQFANPFKLETGATAHIGMLTPLLSALCYRLFGIDSTSAELALSLCAIGFVSAATWFNWRLLVALETPVFARILAVAFVALVPIQFGLEVREGRSWEVLLAACGLTWALLQMVLIDRGRAPKLRLPLLSIVTGLIFILSPPAGLAAILSLTLLYLRKPVATTRWIAPAALIMTVVCLTSFWSMRNVVELGEAIPLRDNLGLELALSNFTGALDAPDQRAEYVTRIHQIHPLGLGQGIVALQSAGGELPYYHMLWRQSVGWIAANPREFIVLSGRRMLQFYLPPRWFWATYSAPGKGVLLRQLAVWLSVGIGLVTLAIMVFRNREYSYFLIAIVACSLPYIAIQPILRYRYLVSTLLIFLAFDGMGRLVRYMLSKRHQGINRRPDNLAS
jgi:hypothetical protein